MKAMIIHRLSNGKERELSCCPVGSSHIEGGVEYGTSFASSIEKQKP
jgi:hypothetical protein